MRRAVPALILALALSACAAEDAPEGYVVVVPAGTAASGGDVSGLLAPVPQERYDGGIRLLVEVGDTLTVVNEDDVEHTVGLLVVRPGERLTYRFSVAGDFVGVCTLLAGEELTVRVS